MKRTIIFSKNAEKSLFELFEYLEINGQTKLKINLYQIWTK